jgi:subtilisin family serine protease
LGVYTLKNFRRIGVQHVKLPKGMTVEEALEIYRSDPDVEYVEPNYLRYATATPDDTFFTNLWGLHNSGQNVNGTAGTADADIDGPEAWDTTTGSTSVVVAVIDSGVDYNHPDLAANIWTNPAEFPGNGLDDDGNGLVDDVQGWDFVDNDNNPMDNSDHGTHVA